MWKPTNLMEALLPIFILDWIFCYGVMHYKSIKKLKIKHSFLYSIITVTFNFFFLITLLVTFYNKNWITELGLARFIMRIINFIVMIINVIIGWILRNKAVNFNINIVKVDESLKNFEIFINVNSEYHFTIMISILWICFCFITSTIEIFTNEKFHKLLTVLLFNFTTCYGSYVNSLTELRFFLLIKHMRLRFKKMNQVLEDVFKLHIKNSTPINTIDKWAIPIQIDCELNSIEFFQNIRRLYLELRLLCCEITKIYGTPIGLTMIGTFVHITGLIFVGFEYLINSDYDVYNKTINTIKYLIWLLSSCLKFFSINYICEQTINEWEQTVKILDKLELEIKDTKFQKEIQKFSAQIQRNPLKFSPCGFFDLGSYFIRDFVAAVVTYLVIIFQTYSNPSKNY